MKLAIAAVGFCVLMALHIDAWRTQGGRLFFGWLPEELAYRLAWVLLAWIYLQFICAKVWRGDEE